jgi:ribonuclease HI
MVVRPIITYAAMVWWLRSKYKTSQVKLSKLQRLACLGITEAMKTNSAATIGVLLGLPPLHLKMEAEAWAGIHKLSCNEQCRSKSLWYGHMSKAPDMMREPILQMGTDKMILIYAFHKPLTVRLPNRSEWERGIVPMEKGRLTWYTDGSKSNEGTGASVYSHGMMQRLSFSLGQNTTVFQAEVYAIKVCADENIKRGYCKRNIYILSDSQAATEALDICRISSRLVCDYHQPLMILAECNKVYLLWVLGHKGIQGNDIANQLASKGSQHLFIGPEPACGISGRVAERAIRDWVCREHQKYWQSIPG